PAEGESMMRARTKTLWALGALICLAGMPRVSGAEANGPHLNIEPWYGYAKFAKNINFEDKSIYGGTLGLSPYRYFVIEGFLARISPDTQHGTTLWADNTSLALPVGSDITWY